MIGKFQITLDQVAYEIEQKGDVLIVNGQEFPYKYEGSSVQIGGNPHAVTLAGSTATVDGITYSFSSAGLEETKDIKKRKAATKQAAQDAGALTAIMPGLIVKIHKKVGDTVQKDDIIMILEAMKMQNELHAAKAGTIRQINVKEGETVEMRQVLAIIE